MTRQQTKKINKHSQKITLKEYRTYFSFPFPFLRLYIAKDPSYKRLSPLSSILTYFVPIFTLIPQNINFQPQSQQQRQYFLSFYYQQMTLNKFNIQQKNAFLKDTQIDHYSDVISQLKNILSSLLTEKEYFDNKFHQEKTILTEEIHMKSHIIKRLENENEGLKQQNKDLLKQIQDQNVLIESLKKGNNKTQIQMQGIKNVLHYLQRKNRQLTEEIYELNKKKAEGDNISKGKLKRQIYSAKSLLDHESIMEYCQLEQPQTPISSIKNNILPPTLTVSISCQSQSERITKETEVKTCKKAGFTKKRQTEETLQIKKSSDLKKSKGQLKSKRQPISKSQMNNLLKNTSKQYFKTGLQKQLSNVCNKSQANLKSFFNS